MTETTSETYLQGNTAGELFSKEGKYLTFKLSSEEYGLEILKVREIIGLMEITPVPRTPDFVRGIINLRGKIIPVIDLRLKFGMEPTPDTDETCIIVVDINSNGEAMQMGILVDAVSEVLDIKEGDIESSPSFGADFDSSFIRGMAKAKGKVKILLNIEKVLTAAEKDATGKAALGEQAGSKQFAVA